MIEDNLDETKLAKPNTLAAYTTALNYFTASCHKVDTEDIDRNDLVKFCAFLRDEKERAARRVCNKFENLMALMKAQRICGLVSNNDWPGFSRPEPALPPVSC
ncbi:MAG: hypothetical protein ABSD75_15510 [Terriglobales bacterium]